jgi:acyl-CoA synthetase (AMP-forming)/AMP-acid ligase II
MMSSPRFAAQRVASVRLISCGGAGVTPEFARRASDVFGAVVKRTYGSTEAPTMTTSYAGDPAERGWTTDGRPVGDVELRVDPVTGELSVRGRELFTSYDDPDVTAQALDDDGWFRTGDRARVDDGWLTILGRLGDTIIRGGENVDPAEVEAVCASLPGVAQTVVVGYPDEEMGERVGLVVVGRAPSADEVRAHCAAAGLARFKTPERVLAVAEMPILTVGKPDRSALSLLLSSSNGG